jgi:hypothetical protein
LPEPQTKRIDNKQKPKLDWDGVAQPHGRLDRAVKARQILGQHNSPFHKAADNGAYPQMNQQFGTNEDGKCNKESGVYFNVAEEREDAYTTDGRGENREQQQRHPYEYCDDDNSASQELEVTTFQVGSSKELEDRATQHQGEIMLFFDEIVLCHCGQA